MTNMPELQTDRLFIRPLVMEDLEAVNHLLDIELAGTAHYGDAQKAYQKRKHWMEWAVQNTEALAELKQPPYGERAVILQATDQLIGLVGYVPCLAPFKQVFNQDDSEHAPYTTEMGLYYAFSPAHQKEGYATEAVKALIDYAFNHLLLGQIVATTEADNEASLRVMEKLGMAVYRNPLLTPEWLQCVGVLKNPAFTKEA